MMRSSWRVLAFGALLASVALPASAQVVVGGGSSAPNVEVNWSVLDNLGRQPNLADMLKTDPAPGETQTAKPRAKAPAGVQYRPYKPGAQPYAKATKPAKSVKAPAAKAAKPAQKAKVVPASSKGAAADHMADLVQSSRNDAKVGPQVALPELPKPAAPVQLAKVPEPPPVAKVEAPKVELPKAVEAPKVELPKAVEAPKVELPKAVEAPKVELPKAVEAAKVELPKAVEAAKVELPKAVEAAKVELPKAVEAPKVELPKAVEVPKVEVPKLESPALPLTALTPPPLPVAPPQQVAALTPSPVAPAVPAATGFKGDTLTIPFTGESARVPDSSLAELDRLAKRMLKDEGLALQLLAYADGDDANASKARRLSLSRALEVRKYLMDQGLRSTRIEVRALGNKLERAGSPDRVDAVLVSR